MENSKPGVYYFNMHYVQRLHIIQLRYSFVYFPLVACRSNNSFQNFIFSLVQAKELMQNCKILTILKHNTRLIRPEKHSFSITCTCSSTTAFFFLLNKQKLTSEESPHKVRPFPFPGPATVLLCGFHHQDSLMSKDTLSVFKHFTNPASVVQVLVSLLWWCTYLGKKIGSIFLRERLRESLNSSSHKTNLVCLTYRSYVWSQLL